MTAAPLIRPTGNPPPYFDQVKQNAARRWKQLEDDPELAGPWHQLFRQVQSPRHVLSELLQNADDCLAKSVVVSLSNDEFVFCHDGADFSEDDFASLCRFGYSNKRNLHTIGFRGIGFKSTFSLGDRVYVRTPTLSVEFRKQRFTEPQWVKPDRPIGHTEIRVRLANSETAVELKTNLDELSKSAASLLFFSTIKRLTINGATVKRETTGRGPVPNSQHVVLANQDSTHRLLVFASDEAEFPDEVYLEIKQERFAEELELPPCRVEIVLGLPTSKLYVVLPTNVEPRLPFSCNAPFMQDPARTGIKNQSISPTNRWLLSRIAELAAHSMLKWLGHRELTTEQRALAYQLLPRPGREGDSVTFDCEGRVSGNIAEICEDIPSILTSSGGLVEINEAWAVPHTLHTIWSPNQIAELLDFDTRPLLAGEVKQKQRDVLQNWGWITQLTDDDVAVAIKNDQPPRPGSFDRLLILWDYARRISRGPADHRELAIVPVEQKNTLRCADDVVRLGRSKRLKPEDWDLLATFVAGLDSEWLDHLWQSDPTPRSLAARLQHAQEDLGTLRLDNATSFDRLVDNAANAFFSLDEGIIREQLIQFTQIVAVLNARIPECFQYATQDNHLRTIDDGVVLDPTGAISDISPEAWQQAHCLNDAYTSTFFSCSQSEWEEWSNSEASGLSLTPPFESQSQMFWNVSDFESFLATRNIAPPESYNYKSGRARVADIDFDSDLVEWWEADDSPDIWHRVLKLYLEAPAHNWHDKSTVKAFEVSMNSNTRPANCGMIPASWIVRLREERCLLDTYGQLAQPTELFMRTPDTEPLLGVERFVRAEYDTAETKELLRLLGVNETAAGPDKILSRIQALANADVVLHSEVRKWYEALDRLIGRCDQETLRELRNQFADESLILTDNDEWATSDEVFIQASDEDIPDAPVIHNTLSDFSMWSRLQVADRPTADLVIDWLRGIEPNRELNAANLKRVRNYLERFPKRIWEETEHWLTISNQWRPTALLDLSMLEDSDARLRDLFPEIKDRTADFRRLNETNRDAAAFRALTSLGGAIEYRLTEAEGSTSPFVEPWLLTLANGLKRIRHTDEESTLRIRQTASRLTQTLWQPVNVLRVTPYIHHVPCGQPHSPTVLWHEDRLYVCNQPLAELVRDLGNELSRVFEHSQISEAIKYCVDRDSEFITSYLEHNFDLDHQVEDSECHESPSATDDQTDSEYEFPDMPSLPPQSLEGGQQLENPFPDITQELRDGFRDRVDEELPSEATVTEAGLWTDAGSGDDDASSSPFPTADERVPPKPKLIDRFAESANLSWDEERQLYVHPEGMTLQRENGPFPWQLYTATGELKCSYRLSEQCLTSIAGVELNSEVWHLISMSPDDHALILVDEAGQPKQWLGSELVAATTDGPITLFAAKYRLRWDSKDNS